MEASIDQNAQDDDGITALHIAASQGDGRVVRFLLEADADASLCDNDTRTQSRP